MPPHTRPLPFLREVVQHVVDVRRSCRSSLPPSRFTQTRQRNHQLPPARIRAISKFGKSLLSFSSFRVLLCTNLPISNLLPCPLLTTLLLLVRLLLHLDGGKFGSQVRVVRLRLFTTDVIQRVFVISLNLRRVRAAFSRTPTNKSRLIALVVDKGH